MNLFEQVLGQSMAMPEPEPGDYVDSEGYRMCGKCHTRKEYEIDLLGAKRRVPVACKCAQEEMERKVKIEKFQKRKNEIADHIAILQDMGAAIVPGHTFAENDSMSRKNTDTMTGYADHFRAAIEKNIGLMLYGNPGAGKTFYAECIANQVLEDGLFAWMTTIKGITEAMKLDKGENRKVLLHYIRNVDLLILDDFGAERDTPYMAEQVLEIINARSMAKLPLIVTTNLEPSIMAQEKEITYRRIYERVFEMCGPVRIEGETRRAGIASRKIADLKEILRME